jgi:hypothetical protein
VYFGDIGKDSNVIRNYFAKNGAACPPNVNPAEYMLEAIGKIFLYSSPLRKLTSASFSRRRDN